MNASLLHPQSNTILKVRSRFHFVKCYCAAVLLSGINPGIALDDNSWASWQDPDFRGLWIDESILRAATFYLHKQGTETAFDHLFFHIGKDGPDHDYVPFSKTFSYGPNDKVANMIRTTSAQYTNQRLKISGEVEQYIKNNICSGFNIAPDFTLESAGIKVENISFYGAAVDLEWAFGGMQEVTELPTPDGHLPWPNGRVKDLVLVPRQEDWGTVYDYKYTLELNWMDKYEFDSKDATTFGGPEASGYLLNLAGWVRPFFTTIRMEEEIKGTVACGDDLPPVLWELTTHCGHNGYTGLDNPNYLWSTTGVFTHSPLLPGGGIDALNAAFTWYPEAFRSPDGTMGAISAFGMPGLLKWSSEIASAWEGFFIIEKVKSTMTWSAWVRGEPGTPFNYEVISKGLWTGELARSGYAQIHGGGEVFGGYEEAPTMHLSNSGIGFTGTETRYYNGQAYSRAQISFPPGREIVQDSVSLESGILVTCHIFCGDPHMAIGDGSLDVEVRISLDQGEQPIAGFNHTAAGAEPQPSFSASPDTLQKVEKALQDGETSIQAVEGDILDFESLSFDPDHGTEVGNGIRHLIWRVNGKIMMSGTSAKFAWQVPAAGSFDVSVEVFDDDGKSSSFTREVEATAHGPDDNPHVAFVHGAEDDSVVLVALNARGWRIQESEDSIHWEEVSEPFADSGLQTLVLPLSNGARFYALANGDVRVTPPMLVAPHVLKANDTEYVFSAAGAAGAILPVAANIAWTASTDAHWLQLQGTASGEVSGSLVLNVAPNSSSIPREGVIRLSGGEMTLEILVLQEKGATRSVAGAMEFDPSEGVGNVLSVTGLPAGLTWNRGTGLISGIPTWSGTFRARVRVRDEAGNVAQWVLTLVIDPLPASAVGKFEGLIALGEVLGDGLGGEAQFQVTPRGSVTGTIRWGGKTQRWRGKVAAEPGRAPEVRGSLVFKGQEPILLTASLADNHLVEGNLVAPEGAASFTGWRCVWQARKNEVSEQVKGRYNLLLQPDLPWSADASVPSGSGFAALTVKSNGRIVWVGRAGEGSAFIRSGILGPSLQAACWRNLHRMQGALTAKGEIGPEASFLGDGLWVKTGPSRTGDRVYRDGFGSDLDGPVHLLVHGGRWQKPGARQSLLQIWGLDNSPLALTLKGSGGIIADSSMPPLDIALLLTSNHLLRPPTEPDENPWRLVSRFSATTGRIWGSFEVRDPPLVTEGKDIVRRVRFEGLWLPDSRAGGFFLGPIQPNPEISPTATLRTTPIVSGLWQLQGDDLSPE